MKYLDILKQKLIVSYNWITVLHIFVLSWGKCVRQEGASLFHYKFSNFTDHRNKTVKVKTANLKVKQPWSIQSYKGALGGN